MKKLLSILLVALLLCGVMGVGLSVSAAPAAPQAINPLLPLIEFIAQNNLQDLNEAQTKLLIEILKLLKTLNIDYSGLLASVDSLLPMSVKAALHEAGLANYPIWERDMMWYLIFRYLLFGWYWM